MNPVVFTEKFRTRPLLVIIMPDSDDVCGSVPVLAMTFPGISRKRFSSVPSIPPIGKPLYISNSSGVSINVFCKAEVRVYVVTLLFDDSPDVSSKSRFCVFIFSFFKVFLTNFVVSLKVGLYFAFIAAALVMVSVAVLSEVFKTNLIMFDSLSDSICAIFFAVFGVFEKAVFFTCMPALFK